AADEAHLRVSGPTLLADVESGEQRRVEVTAAAQAGAGEALAAHNERLRRICASLSLRCSTALASDDWERVLLRHLGA
ncbi:MAG: hypothetical protein WD448_06355, partial [Woeseia sp.]